MYDDLYRKIRRNIQSNISRLRKQGWEVQVELPPIPKNKKLSDIRKLQKITPDYIRENSRFIDYSTGEIFDKPTKGEVREVIREQKSYLAQLRIIEVFYNEISRIENLRAQMLIENWFTGWLNTMGREYVAEVLQSAADNGVQFELQILASDIETIKQEVETYIQRIMQYDTENGALAQEAMADIMFEE